MFFSPSSGHLTPKKKISYMPDSSQKSFSLGTFLAKYGIRDALFDAFEQQRLTEARLLLALNDSDLRELGVTIGDRKRLGWALRDAFPDHFISLPGPWNASHTRVAPALEVEKAKLEENESKNLSDASAERRKRVAQKMGGLTAVLETGLVIAKMTRWWTQLLVYLPGMIASFYALQWRQRLDVWAAARGLRVHEKPKTSKSLREETDPSEDPSSEGDEGTTFFERDMFLETVSAPELEDGQEDGRKKLRLAAAFVLLKTLLIVNLEFLLILLVGAATTLSQNNEDVSFASIFNYVLDSESESATAFHVLAIVLTSVFFFSALLFSYTIYTEFARGLVRPTTAIAIGNVRLRKLRVLSASDERDTRVPELSDLEKNPISSQDLKAVIENWNGEGEAELLKDEWGPCGAVIKLIKFGA